MSEKEEKEAHLLRLINAQIGKGKHLLADMAKKKREPTEEEIDQFLGKFIFDTTPEDLIKEIESSRTTGRNTDVF